MNFDLEKNRRGFQSLKFDECIQHFGRDDVIPMWVADMDFELAPCIKEAMAKRIEHGIFGYTSVDPSMFEAVQSWFKRRYQWHIFQQHMAYSPSVIMSLALLIELKTQVGDQIVVQPPVYTPFKTVIEQQQRTMLLNPLVYENHQYKMDIQGLETLFQTHPIKLFILCNPHNPVGRVWTKDELEALHQCCHKYKVQVISDEIHADITYDHHYTPYATIDDDAIILVSPTKSFNLAGIQGSFVIGKGLETFVAKTRLLHVKRPTVMSRIAIESCYNQGEAWLEALLVYLRQNVETVVSYMKENLPKLHVVYPEGTYLIWIDCRDLKLGHKLHAFFLSEAKVAFEASDFIAGGEGFIRMNIACPSHVLKRALIQMHHAIKHLESEKSDE